MKAADVLRAAKAIIADPTKWTKGDYARNAEGKPVDAYDWIGHDTGAVCFCALGAVRKAGEYESDGNDAVRALDKAAEERCGAYAAHEYNDAESTTHEDILSLFDRAIELAEGGAS